MISSFLATTGSIVLTVLSISLVVFIVLLIMGKFGVARKFFPMWGRDSTSTFIPGAMWGLCMSLTLIVIVGIFGYVIGMKSASLSSLSYAQQLNEWQGYTVIAEHESGKSTILLLQTEGNLVTVRVNSTPPSKHFVLIKGKPVAVPTIGE